MSNQTGYVPNELLSRLVGNRICSVEFVLNDYVQLRFDGEPGGFGPVTLSCYVWPEIVWNGRIWNESDLGYADALRKLVPGTVTSTSEETGTGISMLLDTGGVRIHPKLEEVHVEVAHLAGFADGAWMVWRPGEDSFEDLV